MKKRLVFSFLLLFFLPVFALNQGVRTGGGTGSATTNLLWSCFAPTLTGAANTVLCQTVPSRVLTLNNIEIHVQTVPAGCTTGLRVEAFGSNSGNIMDTTALVNGSQFGTLGGGFSLPTTAGETLTLRIFQAQAGCTTPAAGGNIVLTYK